MYCKICQEWLSAKHRKKDDDGNKTRSCIKTHTLVPANQLACDKFEIAQTFWCTNSACFLAKEICINSVQTKNECKECRIGLFVLRRSRINGRKTLIKVRRDYGNEKCLVNSSPM